MKKILALTLALTLSLLTLSACGDPSVTNDGSTDPNIENDVNTGDANSDNKQENTAPENQPPTVTNREYPSASRNEVDYPTETNGLPSFISPLDTEALDLHGTDDISSNNMTFTYDEFGRILTCSYTVDGREMYAEYAYNDDGITVFGFCNGSMSVDTMYFPTAGFDASLGYTVYDGFYFFGYSFTAR